MPPGSRMPMTGLQVGSPSGPPYGAASPMRPGMPQSIMDPFRKRLLAPQAQPPLASQRRGLKRRKMADKVLPQRIRELVPESQAYMDLLAFERKLDQTIARKRMEIQEAIKKPLTQKRKLRIYISNTFTPGKEEGDGSERVASWELRVEGKLLEDPSKQKRKFSSFFKSLVIELDKELYGPDNHLVEVRRAWQLLRGSGWSSRLLAAPRSGSLACELQGSSEAWGWLCCTLRGGGGRILLAKTQMAQGRPSGS
uniref:SWI/SNF related, matrix associated, actin dependent regulator of chromatin, subfamily d, member 3 n=1 Tax=Terrapene triunguis TaxID=2587831 RepID=A0A674JJG8_9SAUR